MRELICLKTAAKQLNLAPVTVYKMVSEKRIPHVKVNRRVLFDPEKLAEWIAEHEIPVIK